MVHWIRGGKLAIAWILLISLLGMSGGQRLVMADGDTDQGKTGQSSEREYTLNDFYFDTVISIRFYAGESGEDLIDGCRSICDEIQHTFSRTDENSELYADNHREKEVVEVSAPLAFLVQTGLDYYDLSGGKFDITIAPLSDLWDFKSGDAIVPEEAAIQSALRKVDASAVHVRWDSGSGKDQAEEEAGDMPETEAGAEDMSESETGAEDVPETEVGTEDMPETGKDAEDMPEMERADTPEMETEPEIKPDPEPEAYTGEEGKAVLYFDNPDTMIDLGALVKGYAADRLSAYLKKEGVTSGLINLGGNVLAIGPKPDGSAWKIGIQKPFDTGIVDTVEVADQSVVSSGVYERCFEKNGKLYHHILDPTTGYPAETGLWGVSIISDSSLTGDALSTTCLLLGIDEASELIRPMDGVRAIFVDDRLHVSG